MAKKNTSGMSDPLLAEFKALVADTEHLLQHSVDLTGDKAEELRGQINSSLQRARQALGSTEQALLERGKEALSDSQDYVREHPLQSLAIGAGVGFLLGLLVSRR